MRSENGCPTNVLTHRLKAGHFGGQVVRQPFVFSIQHVVHRTGA